MCGRLSPLTQIETLWLRIIMLITPSSYVPSTFPVQWPLCRPAYHCFFDAKHKRRSNPASKGHPRIKTASLTFQYRLVRPGQSHVVTRRAVRSVWWPCSCSFPYLLSSHTNLNVQWPWNYDCLRLSSCCNQRPPSWIFGTI